MDENEIKALLQAGLGDAQIELVSEGNKIGLRLIGSVFEGLNRVKRQQLVYGILDEKIKTGEIHAVTMTCQTPAENAANG